MQYHVDDRARAGGATGTESATAAGPDRVLRGFTELLDLLPGGRGA